MKVSKKTLLLIAGTVWLIAGINILRIGLTVRTEKWSLPMCLLSLAVLLSFHFLFSVKWLASTPAGLSDMKKNYSPFTAFQQAGLLHHGLHDDLRHRPARLGACS
ncbi:MAG: hypothetical protein ACLVLH_21930 [Eisenbergiella massiliensis]